MTNSHSIDVIVSKQAKKRKLLTTAEFISRAKLVHGERYNYDSAKYIKSSLKIKIACKKHGVFEQSPHNHLKGANCPECGSEKRKEYYASVRKEAAKEFKERAHECHGVFYDYSMVNYKTANIKIKIICPNHGIFTQSPHEHISGTGCPKCARERINKATNQRRLRAARDFERKSRKVHGDKYEYGIAKYENNGVKLDIICSHHGVFSQTPRCHLKGNGCPDCAREIASGWSRSEFVAYANARSSGMAMVYIIKCWNESEAFYKIGVTTQNVEKRFHNKKSMPYEFRVIKTIKGKASFVYDTEIQLHRMNKENHYTPKFPFGGSVLECFTEISQDTLFLLDAI